MYRPLPSCFMKLIIALNVKPKNLFNSDQITIESTLLLYLPRYRRYILLIFALHLIFSAHFDKSSSTYVASLVHE